MAGYAAYSLVHERHKSWYSWGVTSLTGFVYVFGFVMMTPQVCGCVVFYTIRNRLFVVLMLTYVQICVYIYTRIYIYILYPQLYINYKLKSVSHLPWRTMVYKALNTFIDDRACICLLIRRHVYRFVLCAHMFP